jgi:CheY-like chemotaxis protein
MSRVPTRILLIEDNPIDIRLIRLALEAEESWNTETEVISDGEEAIKYIAANTTKIDLIILDLSLPKRDGSEVLTKVRSTAGLQGLPVIVLSSAPEDMISGQVRSLDGLSSSYVSKPVEVKEFLELGPRIRRLYIEASKGKSAGGGVH